ncbi:unnamed protein product [Schistosoma curassoni]|uniref:Uncharacterized protein n=1 Tax=Schistosoma curassoni TaxID=6186 RepID=A0A183L0K1_9TREM|nr:unnamed protein product [Schistosoma curassoni]
MQNTLDPVARHYQQQSIVGENKLDPSGGRNQEEVLKVDRTHSEQSTHLCHKASLHLEPSRPKDERKIKEHITPGNENRYEQNEQQLNRIRKEDPGQNGLENAARNIESNEFIKSMNITKINGTNFNPNLNSYLKDEDLMNTSNEFSRQTSNDLRTIQRIKTIKRIESFRTEFNN